MTDKNQQLPKLDTAAGATDGLADVKRGLKKLKNALFPDKTHAERIHDLAVTKIKRENSKQAVQDIAEDVTQKVLLRGASFVIGLGTGIAKGAVGINKEVNNLIKESQGAPAEAKTPAADTSNDDE